MGSAFDDRGRAYQRQARLFLELGDREGTAVAHRGLDLVERAAHAVLEGAGVGNVGVDALDEAKLRGAAQVVALPVAGTRRALAPVLLHVLAVDVDALGRALVKAGEVAAQHHKVGTHGKGERHVVVVDDATIGAHGHVDAGLLVVLVTGAADVDQRGGLATTDTLGLAGDANGAAADTDLDEVGTAVGQEAEAFGVDDVAGTDLDVLAVVGTNPLDGTLLPLAEALGGVDAQDIGTGLDKQRHALGIVAGVDTGADHVALIAVEQLVGVGLVAVVVLAKDDAHEVIVVVDDGQSVELVVPDDVVGNLEADVLVAHDELLTRGHELGDLLLVIIAAGAIVTAGDDTHELALGGAIVGNRHSGVTGLFLEGDNLLHSHVGSQRGIGLDKAGLVILDGLDHGGLGLGGLGTVNEGQATLGSERDTHVDARDGLHDGGNHGDVQGDCRLLTALKTGQRRLKRDVVGDALRGRVTRDQQILRKRVGLTGKERSHVSPFSMRPVGCRPRRTQPNLGRPILGKYLNAL